MRQAGERRTVQRNTLAHYTITDRVGGGGMGVVYKARDTRLQRDVALKLIPEGALTQLRRARFLREARLAASLNHPNICTIYEVGEVASNEHVELATGERFPGGTPFIAMEHIEGDTLGNERFKSPSLRLEDLLELICQVAEGLAEAHTKGIVHRDLKPQNIMVTAAGQVKILDFGLAKALAVDGGSEESCETKTVDPALTLEGTFAGTPVYTSPEVVSGLPADSRSDVFSFGTMVYELLTSKVPFRDESPMLTMARIVDTEPEPLSRSRTDLPTEFERIVGRCLRKRPEDRYNDTRDLVISLKEVLGDLRRDPTPTLEKGKRELGELRTGALLKWCTEQAIPGLNRRTYNEVVEYVLGEQDPTGRWPGHGDHWSVIKTACVVKALALLGFDSRDLWTLSRAQRPAGGVATALDFLSGQLSRLSLAGGLMGEDIWDTCQVLLALGFFGRAEACMQYANEINCNWESYYAHACESDRAISWVGPSYLAAMIDVVAYYSPHLDDGPRIHDLLEKLKSLEHTHGAAPTGSFHAVHSADPNKHRWNTALVLRTLSACPVQESETIDRTTRWLLSELERADEWLGATDRESPMYLARSLDGLSAAATRVGPDLGERIRRALEYGNQRLEGFWSPVEEDRTGDLKAYTCVLEYLAGLTLRIPAGLVLDIPSDR